MSLGAWKTIIAGKLSESVAASVDTLAGTGDVSEAFTSAWNAHAESFRSVSLDMKALQHVYLFGRSAAVTADLKTTATGTAHDYAVHEDHPAKHMVCPRTRTSIQPRLSLVIIKSMYKTILVCRPRRRGPR